MRTTRLVAGLFAAGLLATACGSSTKSSSNTPAPSGTNAPSGTTAPAKTIDCKPVKAGVLSVVTSLPGPNFWGTTKAEVDPDLIKSGIEYDMANLIAAKCGLKMTFRNENFDAIVAGQIDPKSYDIVLSQVTITADRAKVVDFSVGYFKSDQGLLVNKGTTVKTWDDVKKLTVGVQASTTAEYLRVARRHARLAAPQDQVVPRPRLGVRGALRRPGRRDHDRHPDQPRSSRSVGW